MRIQGAMPSATSRRPESVIRSDTRIAPHCIHPALSAQSRQFREAVRVNVQDTVDVKAVYPDGANRPRQLKVAGRRSAHEVKIRRCGR